LCLVLVALSCAQRDWTFSVLATDTTASVALTDAAHWTCTGTACPAAGAAPSATLQDNLVIDTSSVGCKGPFPAVLVSGTTGQFGSLIVRSADPTCATHVMVSGALSAAVVTVEANAHLHLDGGSVTATTFNTAGFLTGVGSVTATSAAFQQGSNTWPGVWTAGSCPSCAPTSADRLGVLSVTAAVTIQGAAFAVRFRSGAFDQIVFSSGQLVAPDSTLVYLYNTKTDLPTQPAVPLQFLTPSTTAATAPGKITASGAVFANPSWLASCTTAQCPVAPAAPLAQAAPLTPMAVGAKQPLLGVASVTANVAGAPSTASVAGSPTIVDTACTSTGGVSILIGGSCPTPTSPPPVVGVGSGGAAPPPSSSVLVLPSNVQVAVADTGEIALQAVVSRDTGGSGAAALSWGAWLGIGVAIAAVLTAAVITAVVVHRVMTLRAHQDDYNNFVRLQETR